ncbi:MAG TPA: hypothetical protein VEX35_06500 [Allosphingosinicella sp.]|nr:hypothetical protein [Allosphingosinicella sp.]
MKARFAALALLLAMPAPAVAQPQDINAAGTVPHVAARAGFPEQVGEFRRSHVLRYDPDDIGANYNLRRGDDFLRLSVYIYPAPRVPRPERAAACREVMAGIGREIDLLHPGAQRTESGEAAALPGTEPGLRFRSVHRLRTTMRSRTPEAVRRESRLYCYVGGDWLVKYYASSNAAFDVEQAIEAFVRDSPWPGRGPASIAMR